MKRSLTTWQMNKIARSPSAHAKFITTGKAPEPASPKSPLIDLLLSMTPRERSGIRGLIVDHRLGYTGQRTFESAAHALNWLKPSYQASSYPSESWQDKRFTRKLTRADLLACSTGHQAELAKREQDQDPEPLSGPEL